MSSISYVSDRNPVYKQDLNHPQVITIQNILDEVIDLDLLSSRQYKMVLSNCKRTIARRESMLNEDLTHYEEAQAQAFIRDVEDLQNAIQEHFAEYLI